MIQRIIKNNLFSWSFLFLISFGILCLSDPASANEANTYRKKAKNRKRRRIRRKLLKKLLSKQRGLKTFLSPPQPPSEKSR